jgi:hypothetical protein
VIAFGALASLGAAACEILLPTKASEDADAGVAAAEAGDGADADTCVHALPPARPTSPDAGGFSIGPSFVMAVQVFPDYDSGAPLGLDLDGVCTCPGPESCASGATPHCDTPGGRDISGNDFLGFTIEGYIGATPLGDITARINRGLLTYLLEVRGYAGGPDQSKVVVGFYDSSGLYAIVDGGLVAPPPAWNGEDTWAIDCRLSAADCVGKGDGTTWLGDGGFSPGIVDERGYVANSVLVAQFPSVVVNLALTTVVLVDAVLVGKLTPELGSYRFDGQLVGHMTTHEMLAAVGRLHGAGGGFLCGDHPDFPRVRKTICEAADLASDSNKATACDALSFAFPFSARPARVGFRYEPQTTVVQGCDGSIDDCDK